jgi:PKD repeat protein
VITAISSNTPPVIDSPPTATPNPATVGQTVSFSVAASDADGDALTYAWTFGDGQSGSGAMPTHVYNVAGTYTATVTVSDGKGGTASGSVTVTVNPPANQAPTVATAAKATPSPATGTTTALSVLGADDGGEANLTYTWATTGTPPAAVAFSPNGTNAAKNSTATFTKAGSYSFQVTIKDAGNLTVTSSVNVTVNQTLTTISVAPTSASVNTGATQQFTATAKDQFGANLTTQPTFSWTASGGGTISSAGLFTAGSTAGGPYTVTASSGGKSGTASVTVTAVATAPTITTQPANQTVTVGQTASFSVVVSGTAPLSYQWYKNNTAIGDATAASYTTSATTTGDHGAKFKVTVSNSAGNLTSNEATLTVNPATAAGRILIACDNGYELYVNGAYVGSGTNWMQMQTYALNFVVGGNVVAVKGLDAGGVAALLAEVQCGTMRLGTSTTWKVSLTGASGWETAGFDDSAWVAAKDYGAYGVGPWGTRVGGCPADTAARWIWTNNNNANDVIFARFSFDLSGTVTVPTITTQPVNVTVTVGQTATFSAAASGTAPLSYQWFKNNTVIDGATAASYTTPATTLADNDAKFKVVATNSAGNATSVEATLTVNAAASQILISCDNGYTLYFNGQQVGAANNWFQMQSYTVKPQLGRNVVAVKCTDAGGVAALLAEVRYGAQRVGTSTDWKVSLTGPTGWETVAFDDGSWAGAKDYGTYGVAPWYKNVSGYPKDTPAHWIWTSNNDADNVIYVRFTFNYDGVAVLGAVPLLGEPKVGGTETGEVGSAATAPNEPLTLGKASVKLNFAKTEMDQIQLAGVLPVAEGFDPTGKTLTVNFGGIELTFTLNAKGQAAEDNNRCKLQLKRKKGVVAAQNAKFLIQLKSGDFALALGDEDLTNTDCRNVEVTIPVAITLGGTTYAADKKLSFSAKADKTGLAK